MDDGDLLIFGSDDVRELLQGRETEVMEGVRAAYIEHANGRTEVPHSTFLRFPDEPRNRIIALPAFLGGAHPVAGVKWVSSFPGNLERGLERASAVLILNSLETGRPHVMMEASAINAKRTAASASVAALALRGSRSAEVLGVVGCGVINFEVVRYLRAALPGLRRIVVHDLDRERAMRFVSRWRSQGLKGSVLCDAPAVLASARLISIATTALEPHIDDLAPCASGTTILHISLRDLTPKAILGCVNIADDVDHVCRAQTSLHLAEQQLGHRDFIQGAIGDVLCGRLSGRPDDRATVVFSPFGLGILDLAVASLVWELGLRSGRGRVLRGFLPAGHAVPERIGA
jgi:ornithine cyclodeaminase